MSLSADIEILMQSETVDVLLCGGQRCTQSYLMIAVLVLPILRELGSIVLVHHNSPRACNTGYKFASTWATAGRRPRLQLSIR